MKTTLLSKAMTILAMPVLIATLPMQGLHAQASDPLDAPHTQASGSVETPQAQAEQTSDAAGAESKPGIPGASKVRIV